MKRRWVLTSLTVFFLVMLAGSAAAEITGAGCDAQITTPSLPQPVDVATHKSKNKAEAIPVPWDGSLTASASTPGPVGTYKVELETWGFRWPVGQGSDSSNNWNITKAVKPYATYGAGYYLVIGSSTGPPPCSGAALIKITGKNPATTVAGIAAMGIGGIGAAGVIGSAVRAAAQGSPKNIASMGYRVLPVELRPETDGGYMDAHIRGAKLYGSEQLGQVADTSINKCGNAPEYTSWVRGICGNFRPPRQEIIELCGKGTQAYQHIQSICTKG